MFASRRQYTYRSEIRVLFVSASKGSQHTLYLCTMEIDTCTHGTTHTQERVTYIHIAVKIQFTYKSINRTTFQQFCGKCSIEFVHKMRV